MENFFVDTEFYGDIDDYLVGLDLYFESKEEAREIINGYSDDWFEKIELAEPEKIFIVEIDDVVGQLEEHFRTWHEDRYPEESDRIDLEIKAAIKASIDIEKLNLMLPTMYYPSGKFDKITKQDLLNAL